MAQMHEQMMGTDSGMGGGMMGTDSGMGMEYVLTASLSFSIFGSGLPDEPARARAAPLP